MADNLVDLSKRSTVGTELLGVEDRIKGAASRISTVAGEVRELRNRIASDSDVFTIADRTKAREVVSQAVLVLLKAAAGLGDLAGVHRIDLSQGPRVGPAQPPAVRGADRLAGGAHAPPGSYVAILPKNHLGE